MDAEYTQTDRQTVLALYSKSVSEAFKDHLTAIEIRVGLRRG